MSAKTVYAFIERELARAGLFIWAAHDSTVVLVPPIFATQPSPKRPRK